MSYKTLIFKKIQTLKFYPLKRKYVFNDNIRKSTLMTDLLILSWILRSRTMVQTPFHSYSRPPITTSTLICLLYEIIRRVRSLMVNGTFHYYIVFTRSPDGLNSRSPPWLTPLLGPIQERKYGFQQKFHKNGFIRWHTNSWQNFKTCLKRPKYVTCLNFL